MICVSCETSLPDDAVCCYKCAYPTSAKFDSAGEAARRVEPIDLDEETVVRVEPPKKPNKQSSVDFIVAGVVVGSLMIAVVILAVNSLLPIKANDSKNYSVPVTTETSIQSPANLTPATIPPTPRPKQTPKLTPELTAETEVNNYPGNNYQPKNRMPSNSYQMTNGNNNYDRYGQTNRSDFTLSGEEFQRQYVEEIQRNANKMNDAYRKSVEEYQRGFEEQRRRIYGTNQMTSNRP